MAAQCEWHAVEWLDLLGGYGVVRHNVHLNRYEAHRGLVGAERRLSTVAAAQRSALGRPPRGVVEVAASFVSVQS